MFTRKIIYSLIAMSLTVPAFSKHEDQEKKTRRYYNNVGLNIERGKFFNSAIPFSDDNHKHLGLKIQYGLEQEIGSGFSTTYSFHVGFGGTFNGLNESRKIENEKNGQFYEYKTDTYKLGYTQILSYEFLIGGKEQAIKPYMFGGLNFKVLESQGFMRSNPTEEVSFEYRTHGAEVELGAGLAYRIKDIVPFVQVSYNYFKPTSYDYKETTRSTSSTYKGSRPLDPDQQDNSNLSVSVGLQLRF